MPRKNQRQSKGRLNTLDGKTWTRYSISIWDIKKTLAESRLHHPALFPQQLVHRLLEIYTKPGDTILDPFMGAGSTILAAQATSRTGIGFEISQSYIDIARNRLMANASNHSQSGEPRIFCEDARKLTQFVDPNTIDLVVTSPPYWNIHRQKRTANGKSPRPYSSSSHDLGNIASYDTFLKALADVAQELFTVVKPNHWCILIVMDLRKRERFYPFHNDCIHHWNQSGFELEDIIIWDRRQEYHNLRPLGYPTTFRVNKVHEYILIFRKPS
ncbi:MAG: DNA methyltransferase [Candidatus Thorarchaeota archaeon]